MDVHFSVCMCVCVCVYIYIYTHTHKRTNIIMSKIMIKKSLRQGEQMASLGYAGRMMASQGHRGLADG